MRDENDDPTTTAPATPDPTTTGPTGSEQASPVPREMTPDLPPAPANRQRARNAGLFPTGSIPRPRDGFAVGVSGRVRRGSTE